MKITYDSVANAAYVYVVDEIGRGEVTRSHPVDIEIENGAIILDFDAENQLLGVEVLGARQVLRPETLNASEQLA